MVFQGKTQAKNVLLNWVPDPPALVDALPAVDVSLALLGVHHEVRHHGERPPRHHVHGDGQVGHRVGDPGAVVLLDVMHVESAVDQVVLEDAVNEVVEGLGVDSIETFWIEFQLEQSLEVWLEIPYAKKMVV